MATEDMLSDIRREAAEHTNEIVREGMRGDFSTQKAITDNLAQTSNQIDAFEDAVNNQFFSVARDTADLRAQVTGLGYQVRDGFAAAAKDSEINGLKTQIELAKQSTYLSDKIDAGNLKTVELLNTLKEADLNRMLIERNAALVEERGDRRHWRYAADQGQWLALNQQIQAFGSQLQEARQGMVNFGTMAGVGQTSSQNNV